MARSSLYQMVNRVLSKAIQEDPKWSRVCFHRRAGFQMGALGGMAAYMNACAMKKEGLSNVSGAVPAGGRVVIVGAGAAGLAAAYYLKKGGVRAEVYEAESRLGGRIDTHYNFNAEGMFCERGGELIDTGHKEIQDLMKELGLELESLPDPDRIPEIHFIGKAWRGEEALVKAFRPMAKRIARDAENFVVKDVFTMPTFDNPISDRVKVLDHMTLKQYLDEAKESPAWVRELIRIAYVGEYGLEAEDQSAINLVSFIGTELDKGFRMFGESDELYRVKGGNSRLIEKLGDELKGQIHIAHSLRSIAIGSRGRIQLLFEEAGGIKEVLAETVIVTLPFSVLRGIKGIDAIGLDPRKLEAIRELGYGTNAKLMLGFSDRYWRRDGLNFPASDGAIITDLPLQGGWDTSRRQQGQSGIFTNFMGGKRGESFRSDMAKATLADLDHLFPGIAKLHDGKKQLKVWAAAPTAKGSYICQKPGQYTAFGGILGTSELEGRLIFAGEHTSDTAPGFMSGAVESGLRSATEYLARETSQDAKTGTL